MEFDIKKHTILRCLHGSRAYGTDTPDSDYDYKGVAIAPINYYLGFLRAFEQSEKQENKGHECDEVIYDLKKFVKLAIDANPSILDVLFIDEADITHITEIGQKLRNNRNLFVSAKAKHTFTGYANSQLKRLKSHRSWLLNPPKKKPERKDFDLPDDKKLISGNDMGAYEELISEDYEFPEHVMMALKKEKAYKTAIFQWKQYQNWLKTRNPERFEMEKKFGFDGKHASHLVRLLQMGLEILQGKGVIVKRPDAKELLAIKNGAWTYEYLIEWAEDVQNKCNDEYEKIKSMNPEARTVPLEPNRKKVDSLCQELIEEFHGIKYD